MRVLDLFCCGGGAGSGYARAGFEVVGVDIEEQLQYPFGFHRADAVQFAKDHATEFDLVHASPPCQAYSPHVSSRSSEWVPTSGKDEPKLIGAIRDVLVESGVPYVIENVMGARADLRSPVQLCGTMFGLPISRHRLFETNWFLPQPAHPKCRGVAKKFAEERGWDYRDMSVTGKGRRAGTSKRWSELLQVEHEMTQHQLAESIPPAYTRYIGEQFMLQRIAR